jgi:16S rRNA processing protein RimM
MKLVYTGTLTKPHGLRGLCFLNILNKTETQLKVGKTVYIESKVGDQLLAFEIESLNLKNKMPLIKLASVDSINHLEQLIPAKLYLNRADFDEVAEGEYYLNDLIGMEVFNQSNKFLGEVVSFYSNGPQDILVTSIGEEFPVIDQFVERVDLEKNKITIIDFEII